MMKTEEKHFAQTASKFQVTKDIYASSLKKSLRIISKSLLKTLIYKENIGHKINVANMQHFIPISYKQIV